VRANRPGIYEVSQNVEILELVERQVKQIEAKLQERYGDVKLVRLLQSIPGIGLLTALTLYAEICDIKRFSNPDKLAHYAGLVREGERRRQRRRYNSRPPWLASPKNFLKGPRAFSPLSARPRRI